MTQILIVEDSRLQAEHLRSVLEEGGFKPRAVHSGEQALQLLAMSDYDLVLTDVLMPGISGYEVCRKIKDDPARRHIPVILLTSLSRPEDIVQGIESGADYFIPKPFRPADLLGRIRNVLATRALRAQSRVTMGVEVVFLGKRFTITSDREQLLDLLLSACEEIVRTNQQLQASQEKLQAAKTTVEQDNTQLRSQASSSEGRYRALMEQANDAILLLDPFGRVREANRRTEELLRLPPGSVVGQHYTEFVPAEDRDRELHELHQIWASHIPRNDHVQLLRRDGEPLRVHLSASVVELGTEQGVLIIARDATEQDRLEQQLRQYKKMEDFGQLAGGVAHDFNNLLTVINGYSDVLLMSSSLNDPEREMIAEIKRAGDRAATLTRKLLTFSRQQVIAPVAVDLNAIVQEASGMLHYLIGEEIELKTFLEPTLGRVKADPGLIEQILMNLAVNARDAMPQGGELTIKTSNEDLDPADVSQRQGFRPGHHVLLTVTDTGCGMDEGTLAHLFEPFYTTKGPGQGTGLGLAVVYGAVKQMGGFVWVDSQPGQGASFEVYLPRVEEAVIWEKPVPEGTALVLGWETILLVESSEPVRKLTRMALRMNGYQVLEAASGEEALLRVQQYQGPIHLLITDLGMKGVEGRPLANQLTALYPELKVLFLSGSTDDPGIRQEAGEELAFLQKPYTPHTLARKVRAALDAPSSERGTRWEGEIQGPHGWLSQYQPGRRKP